MHAFSLRAAFDRHYYSRRLLPPFAFSFYLLSLEDLREINPHKRKKERKKEGRTLAVAAAHRVVMSSPSIECSASSPSGVAVQLLCSILNVTGKDDDDVCVSTTTHNRDAPPRYRAGPGAAQTFEGVVPVCAAICAAMEPSLLGTNEAEKLAIDDWLAAANTTYSGTEFDADCEPALESLNEHLKTKSHVAANDRVTVADIVTFGLIREKVKQMMGSGQLKQKKSLVRWCKRMQSVASTSGESAIDFSALDTKWTTLPRSESGGKTQVSTSEKTKNEKGGAKHHPQGGSQPLDDPAAEAKRLKAIAKKEAKAAEKAAAKAARQAAAAAEGGGGGGGGDAGAAATTEKDVNISVVDIRVGKIVKAWEHPEADKLWAEEIDVGLEKPLQVCSGLREFKTLEDMTNADVLVICNMKPNKMRGLSSEAMVLCASNADHTKVDFVKPPSGAQIGERVAFEGFEGEPEKVLNPKKKQLEKVLPKLKTDADGVACYDGKKAMTSAGPCSSSLKDCFIK